MYKKTEDVDCIDDIKHPLIRECMRMADIDEYLQIMVLADVPAGTGLGSSSAFTVGLLNALYTLKGINSNKYKLAEDACSIEIDILGEPIGKQDQYAAAFGGLNHYVFTNKKIKIHPILADIDTINNLQSSLMLFFSGIERKASDILTDQKMNMDKISPTVENMTWIAQCISTDLHKNYLNSIGYYINQEWELKKATGNVSNKHIDGMIDRAMDAGAEGVKVTGAGSGGFLLVYCDESLQDTVRNELSDLIEFPFEFEEFGSGIIYKVMDK